MREHSFATVIAGGNEPSVSQAPTLVTESDDGVSVEFHLSTQNPQCERLVDGSACLMLYSGPNCYVSPSWYSQHPSVPTWNYVSVEARGTVRRLTSDELAAQLAELSRIHEQQVRGTWRFDDLPAEFRDRLLAEIRGFRVLVADLTAKFKLSQNRTLQDRQSVANRLSSSSDSLDRNIGRLMMETFDAARSPAARR